MKEEVIKKALMRYDGTLNFLPDYPEWDNDFRANKFLDIETIRGEGETRFANDIFGNSLIVREEEGELLCMVEEKTYGYRMACKFVDKINEMLEDSKKGKLGEVSVSCLEPMINDFSIYLTLACSKCTDLEFGEILNRLEYLDCVGTLGIKTRDKLIELVSR